MSRSGLRLILAFVTLLPLSAAHAARTGSPELNGPTVTREISARELGTHVGLVRTIATMRRAVRSSISDRELKFELVRSVHRGSSGELVGYELKVSTPRTIHMLELDRQGQPTSDWTIERFASEIKGK